MRTALAVISGIIIVFAILPYLVDTVQGKTRPRVVTWFTWGSLSAITAIAAQSKGAAQTAIFAAALAVTNYAVVVAGLRQGIKRYTWFDGICQCIAIIGIVLWRLTDQPSLAVLFVIISDLIGALPTYRHIWSAPHEETLSSFIAYLVSDAFILASLASFSFVAAAYPIYITASVTSFVMLIVYRRKVASALSPQAKARQILQQTISQKHGKIAKNIEN